MKNVFIGPERVVRIGPWRGHPDTAFIVTYQHELIDAEDIKKLIDQLEQQRYRRAITAALAPLEQEPFIASGFEPLQELVLMKRALNSTVPRAQHRLRRHFRKKIDDVLAIDAAAFDSFWRIDAIGLREAINSTPKRNLRVTTHLPPIGYALSGVARDRALSLIHI